MFCRYTLRKQKVLFKRIRHEIGQVQLSRAFHVSADSIIEASMVCRCGNVSQAIDNEEYEDTIGASNGRQIEIVWVCVFWNEGEC